MGTPAFRHGVDQEIAAVRSSTSWSYQAWKFSSVSNCATASAREFALVYRLDQQESGEDISRLRQMEQALRDLGFHARLASEQDVKRLLAVYYQQDVTTEWFENCDGERWVMENA